MSPTPQRPRATIHTIGCRLNQAETAWFTSRLQRDGYEVVALGRHTDLLVLNTCSVTENAEKECRYIVRRTLRSSPNAFIVLTGCYAQTGADSLAQLPGVDLIVGTQFKMKLPDLLPAPTQFTKHPSPQVLHSRAIDREEFSLEGVSHYGTARANLKIQDGCDFKCSFCLIPTARGRARSRNFEDVIREAEALAGNGHKEIVLTGVNLGQYHHQGLTLLDVIRRLEPIPLLERIRISSIEPTTIPHDLLDFIGSSEKVCPYLHIPLQSGDDDILCKMNRKHRVGDYVRLIDHAVRVIPHLALGTDLLVGFPGEGEREFSHTVNLVTDLPFSYFHVFSYSRRPGTAAAKHRGEVHQREIHSRHHTLSRISREKRMRFYHSYTGHEVKVLFEQVDKTGWMTGLTTNYIRVGIPPPHPSSNSIAEVTITGMMDGLALGHMVATREPSLPLLSVDGGMVKR